MTSEIVWQPCPKCWRFLIPYENGRAMVVCFGPTFKFGGGGRWLQRRYGALEWMHISPQYAVEVDVHNMNPDPEMLDPRDVRLVNHARSWIAWRGPRPRKMLPKAALASAGSEHVPLEFDDDEENDLGED